MVRVRKLGTCSCSTDTGTASREKIVEKGRSEEQPNGLDELRSGPVWRKEVNCSTQSPSLEFTLIALPFHSGR